VSGQEMTGPERNGQDCSGMDLRGTEGNGKGFMTTGIYPIETESLRKGDSIPVTILQQIAKSPPGTAQYAFKLMSVGSFISRAFALRGEPVTVVIRKNELVILTDAEANTYNMRFAKAGARRIRRSTARHSVIDLSKLTPEQRLEWDRNATRLAMMVQGVSRRKLIPDVKPHKRIE